MLTALALTGALILAGCGGDNDSTSTSTSTTTTSQATVAQKPKTQAAAPKPESPTKGTAKNTAPVPAPGAPGDPTTGAKAPAPGVPVTAEGDNSVQTFGVEGEESERRQAISDLRTYLAAWAAGQWADACEAASAEYKSELAKAVSKTPGGERPTSCAQTLEALFGRAPAAALQSSAQVGEVLSFRVRDDGYAYLIFKAPEGVKFIAMADDGGAWKVNTLEPAAFGQSQGEAR